jgi:hypothetical protein
VLLYCHGTFVPAEQVTEGASALLELAKKSNATSPVEAQPQQPQKSVYLVGCRQPLRCRSQPAVLCFAVGTQRSCCVGGCRS